MTFADKLEISVANRKSRIVAGFDPRPETFPKCILEDAAAKGKTSGDSVYLALTDFFTLAAGALADRVAAVKPNIAFFEQFGLPGLQAFDRICSVLREHDLPIVVDGKRGDIGSTAEAYARAFLGKPKFLQKELPAFQADALTVSPFLGFDTLKPFIQICKEEGKGLFVLVKTSNPGSADLQNLRDQASGKTISDTVASWLAEHAAELEGACGLSGLGAVVGATYPEEARHLRDIMPTNIFLIPGLGSQGGSAEDAAAGFTDGGRGAIVNASRGLLSSFSSTNISREEAREELQARADLLNEQLNDAVG